MANKVVVSSENFNTLVNDNAALSGASFTGNVNVAGNLTVTGTTSTVINLDISDNIIGLNNGLTGASSNDSGFIIERGSTGDNAFMGWDESEDKFIVGTTTATASSLGDLTITTGTLVANLEGDVSGNVTGNVTGTALTVTQAEQRAITLVGTLTALAVDNISIDGNTISSTSGALNLTPVDGSGIILDNTILVDAGVITGATSISSTAFVGDFSGNVTQPAQSAITSLGTLTGLTVIGTVNIDGSLNFTGGLAKTDVSSNTGSSNGNVTSNTAGISHALILSGDLNGGASLNDFTVTSNKVLATSVVVASSNLNLSIQVHTVVAGSFQVDVTNHTGTKVNAGSTVILNYAIL